MYIYVYTCIYVYMCMYIYMFFKVSPKLYLPPEGKRFPAWELWGKIVESE